MNEEIQKQLDALTPEVKAALHRVGQRRKARLAKQNPPGQRPPQDSPPQSSETRRDGSPPAPMAVSKRASLPTHRVSLTADELEKLLGMLQGADNPREQRFVKNMTPVLLKLRMEEQQMLQSPTR